MSQNPTISLTLKAEGASAAAEQVKKVAQAVKDLAAQAKLAQGITVSVRAILNTTTAAAKATAAAGAAGGAAVAATTAKFTSRAEEVAKVAKQLGVSAEFVSSVAVAFERAGGSFEDAKEILVEGYQALGEAFAGESTKIEAGYRLALDFEKLKKLSPEKQLEELITQIGRLEASTSKTFGVADFFGDVGKQFDAAFTAVATRGLERFRAEAERTGELVTTDMAAEAVKSGNAWRALEGQLSGLGNTIAASLLPQVVALAEKADLRAAKTTLDALLKASNLLTDSFAEISKIGGSMGLGSLPNDLDKTTAATEAALKVFTALKTLVDAALGSLKSIGAAFANIAATTTTYNSAREKGASVREAVSAAYKQFQEGDAIVSNIFKESVGGAITRNIDALTATLEKVKNTAPTSTSTHAASTVKQGGTADRLPPPPPLSSIPTGPLPPLPTGRPTAAELPPPIPGTTTAAAAAGLAGTAGSLKANELNLYALQTALTDAQAQLTRLQAQSAAGAAKTATEAQIALANIQAQLDAATTGAQQYWALRETTVRQKTAADTAALDAQIAAQETILQKTKEWYGDGKIDVTQRTAMLEAETALEALKNQKAQITLQTEADLLSLKKEQNDAQASAVAAVQSALNLQREELGDVAPGLLQAQKDATTEMQKQLALRQDLDAPQRLAILNSYTAALSRQTQLKIQQAQIDAATATADAQKSALQAQVDAGGFAGVRAQQELYRLELARIPTLLQILEAQKATAAAAGDQVRTAQIQSQIDQLKVLKTTTEANTGAWSGFSKTLEDSSITAVGDFVGSLTSGATSVRDAWRQAISGIVSALGQWAAKLMIIKAIEAIGGGGTPAAAASGGLIDKLARGGMPFGGVVYGPGTGTSDQVPTLLSRREFVVRNKSVEQPGAVNFLHDFNRRGMPAIFDYNAKRLAAGGLTSEVAASAVGAGVAAAGAGGRSEVALRLEDGLVLKHLKSTEGQKTLLQFAQQNRNALKSILG